MPGVNECVYMFDIYSYVQVHISFDGILGFIRNLVLGYYDLDLESLSLGDFGGRYSYCQFS